MLIAAVVSLEAMEEGVLREATGADVHGFWFRHWREVSPAVADDLHARVPLRPFTLSPLLGLPRPRRGRTVVEEGRRAWFRVATLTPVLSARLEEEWLPRLPDEVLLGGVRWRVVGTVTDAAGHPWAGRADPRRLAEERLLNRSPPSRWQLVFITPTAFHGEAGHCPFPLPSLLVASWLRRWQAFGPVRLPGEVTEWARRLVVSAYTLRTVPVRDGRRLTIGCVGRMALRALRMKPGERAAVDLLVAYAFWCGSGHRTTQGMGVTRGQGDRGTGGVHRGRLCGERATGP